jgi:hypothetical protein
MADTFVSGAKKRQPVLSYSQYPILFIGVSFYAFLLFGGFYSGYMLSDPIPFVISTALWAAGTYVLWTKPLRRVRFYEDYLEIKGWKVSLRADYASVEDLSKVRRVIGDFRSDGTLWFSVVGNPSIFSMPNKLFGKPKIELYQWLLAKNPNAKKG